MIKWLFLDLGSTLIDERDCIEYLTQNLLQQENAPSREVILQKMKENAFKGRLPYKDTAKDLGLETIRWPVHLEKIYESVPGMLEKLHSKYKLGIIANQSIGAEERMKTYGIHHYFDVIMSSAEAGVAKPDLEIFKRALKNAGCKPEETYMIGDRLDNDIKPAAKIGMHTIWVRQGAFADADLYLIEQKPDIIVECVEDILQYL